MMKSKTLLSTWIKRFEFVYLEYIYLEFEIIITRWFNLRQHVCLIFKKSRDVIGLTTSLLSFLINMAHHYNEWLISVPTGRFVVAVASLSHS